MFNFKNESEIHSVEVSLCSFKLLKGLLLFDHFNRLNAKINSKNIFTDNFGYFDL